MVWRVHIHKNDSQLHFIRLFDLNQLKTLVLDPIVRECTIKQMVWGQGGGREEGGIPQHAVLLESCLSLASFLLHSCFSLVPRLKLVFRGSYFLLLIGSSRPSRRRVPQGSSGSVCLPGSSAVLPHASQWPGGACHRKATGLEKQSKNIKNKSSRKQQNNKNMDK